MEFQDLLVRKEDGVAIVTLNRPQALNALSPEMREGLGTLFTAFRDDDSVRAVVLTGAGRAFCAGGDVKAMAEIKPALEMKDFVRNTIHRAVLAITTLEKPVIAMVNGVAAGAGCCIALLCDLIIAAESARFGFAFVRVGLGPDWGGAYFLPRLVGPARAKELLFTGKLIDAREAERIGLINQVVPDEQLEPTVMELARKLARGATRAIGAAKILVHRSLDADLLTMMEQEASMAALLTQSEDHREGVQAFLEKREAVFKGR
jgi:2-(1,2-epoxy-1,2-dihydrophenyl)acetyl-CoA isomerase